jgi:pimeloyl-ACP methyl ester carboxylesterase
VTRWRRCAGSAAAGAGGFALVVLVASRAPRSGQAPGPAEGSATALTDDGVPLHVELDGRADAPVTVVLVHGYGASLSEWRHQRQVLALHSQVVLYDQRGHGRSGWGSRRRATVEQLGDDLRAVLRAHADERPVVLVSHSIGGMALLALACSYPELFGTRVRGVALISTSAGHLVQAGPEGRLMSLLRRTRGLEALLWVLWLVAPVIDRLGPLATAPGRAVLCRRLFGPDGPRSDEFLAAQHDLETTRQSVLAAFAPSLLRHDRVQAVPVLRALPVLVLTGSADAAISPSHSARLRDELAGQCRFVVVPGAGHMVNVTHADAVSGAVLQLLEDVERSAGPRAGLYAEGQVEPASTGQAAGR